MLLPRKASATAQIVVPQAAFQSRKGRHPSWYNLNFWHRILSGSFLWPSIQVKVTMVVEEKGKSEVAPFCCREVVLLMIGIVPCFQSSTMAAISIGCSVPTCDFRTPEVPSDFYNIIIIMMIVIISPEVPSHFYPNMVDQLKVMKWFSTEDILLNTCRCRSSI